MPPKLDSDSDTVRLQLVAPASWAARVDDWRRQQVAIPSRSEAIRALVEKALDDAQSQDESS